MDLYSDLSSNKRNTYIKCNGSYICRFELSFDYFDIGYSNNKMMALNFKSYNSACNFLKFIDTIQPCFSKMCEVL